MLPAMFLGGYIPFITFALYISQKPFLYQPIFGRLFATFVLMKPLESIIEKCLLLKGRFVLPHWGILNVHSTSASIRQDSAKIHPPSEEISFLDLPDISKNELEKELQQFVFSEQIDSSLLAQKIDELALSKKESGFWDLGRLGVFRQSSEGVVWESASPASWSLLNDLPEITLPYPITPVADTTAVANDADSPAGESGEKVVSPAARKKKKTSTLTILLLVLVALGLAFLIAAGVYWYSSSQEQLTMDDIPASTNRVNVHPDKLKESYTLTADTASESDSSPSFELSHRVKSDSKQETTAVEDEPTEEVEPDYSSFDNEPREDSKADDAATGLEESSEDENLSCVIIVGAFSNERNTRQMKDYLSKANYTVFTQNAGQLTRVGLYTHCEPSKILKELREVRKEIEAGAWILNE